jgi:oligopeptide/dipeptide ABC transporter ATP-binding protein
MSGLELLDVRVHYREAGPGARRLVAVDGVSLTVGEGEALGLVGESGCGKTTIGRAILGLVPLAGGSVRWDGRRIDGLAPAALRAVRRELQSVFQDPHACLDPRMTLAESVAEPVRNFEPGLARRERGRRARAGRADVGLDGSLAARYPHQLSGGQLQRAVIARALVADPRFVVCDEPVSALDVLVQGQIIALLERVRAERRLASLFISHNLALVARLCPRMLVMFRGRVVESGLREALVRRPRHPYTRELLDAVPVVDAAARARLAARSVDARGAPAPAVTQAGCGFASRCPHVLPRCRVEAPALRPVAGDVAVACHRAEEWPAGLPPVIRARAGIAG